LADQQGDMHQVMLALMGLLQQEGGAGLTDAGRDGIGIDPSFVAKVKGRMVGVQKWREHSENPDRGRQVMGHQGMLGGLLTRLGERWRCFPIWARLVSGKQQPSHFVGSPPEQVHPRSIWETAIALVVQASSMVSGVMEAYFANACLLNPVIAQGITLLSRLRHDAVGWDDPQYCGRGRPPERGPKWKFARWGKTAPHETVTAHRYGKLVEVSVVVRDVWRRDVSEKGRVVVVEGVQRPMLLACTDLSRSASQLLERYAARFSLALAIRDLKGLLGLGDDQSTTTLAFGRFVVISCVALGLGRLLLQGKHVDGWLDDLSAAPGTETNFRFARLRKGLRCFVLKQLIFSKFPSQADCEKLQDEWTAIVQIAA
jgi:hypothetical protein